MREGLRRTWNALVVSWRNRHDDTPKGYTKDEAQFLDALMEIEESPPAPLARFLLWTMVAMLVIAMVLSYFGRLDIVAEARGKIRPVEEVKVVQSAVQGTVSRLTVLEGSEVGKGDVLVELDTVQVDAETERLVSARTDARLDVAAADLLVEVARNLDGPTPSLLAMPSLAGLDRDLVKERQAGIASRHAETLAQIRQKDAELKALEASRDAELRQAGHVRGQIGTVKKRTAIEMDTQRLEADNLAKLMAIAEMEHSRQTSLLERGTISKAQHDQSQVKKVEASGRYFAARNSMRKIEADGDSEMERLQGVIDGHLDKAAEIEAHHARAESDMGLIQASLEREATDSGIEAKARLRSIDQDLVKTRRLRDDHVIVAPAAGVVEQLAVFSVGAVVEAAQPLMVVVPSGASLHAEVLIENKDVGHVKVGQEVALKLDAFPHFKHGLVPGVLLDIADDAIEDQVLGLVYPARISLGKDKVMVDGREVPLAPGMSVTAEIRTGERRVYEFFLEPLLRHSEQSFDER